MTEKANGVFKLAGSLEKEAAAAPAIQPSFSLTAPASVSFAGKKIDSESPAVEKKTDFKPAFNPAALEKKTESEQPKSLFTAAPLPKTDEPKKTEEAPKPLFSGGGSLFGNSAASITAPKKEGSLFAPSEQGSLFGKPAEGADKP